MPLSPEPTIEEMEALADLIVYTVNHQRDGNWINDALVAAYRLGKKASVPNA